VQRRSDSRRKELGGGSGGGGRCRRETLHLPGVTGAGDEGRGARIELTDGKNGHIQQRATEQPDYEQGKKARKVRPGVSLGKVSTTKR